MLRSIRDLEGYAIHATDGVVGDVKDFYFDDAAWVIRYLIVDTGTWLSSRKVLISPIAIGHANTADRQLPVSITKEQVKSSPDIDTQRPVSRQQEMYFVTHYGYPQYWGETGLWGSNMYPRMMMPEFVSTPIIVEPRLDHPDLQAEAAAEHAQEDPHLRGINEVVSYHIHASDGEIGHVQGMLVDEETWAIRYLIIDTSNWWLGHQVLIAPEWIDKVSWADATVSVKLTQQQVKDAPPYDGTTAVDRQAELAIWAHYGHAGYWTDEPGRVRIVSAR
jgi:hypothetical protein